ncbi:aminotransferase class V-fold PLP-dependent enzyme [bacterium]|nr:aminotransferase class V-fold PLP-dependent enzyme [bacterium]
MVAHGVGSAGVTQVRPTILKVRTSESVSKPIVDRVSTLIKSAYADANARDILRHQVVQDVLGLAIRQTQRRLQSPIDESEKSRLTARITDIHALTAKADAGEITLLGIIGWGEGTVGGIDPRQGVSEYDSVVFERNGVRVVEQLGSSWIRSQLRDSDVSADATVLTPAGVQYNPLDWTRLDGKTDSASFPTSLQSPVSYSRSLSAPASPAVRTRSVSDLEAVLGEVPDVVEPLPLKSFIEAELKCRNPALFAAVKAGNGDEALRLFSETSQRKKLIFNGDFGLNPNVYTDLNAYGLPLTLIREISATLEVVVGNTHGDSILAQASTRFLNESVSGIFSHFGALRYTPGSDDGRQSDRNLSYDILVRGSGFTAAFNGYLDYLKRHISEQFLNGKTLSEGAIAFSVYEHHSDSLPFQDWSGNPSQIGVTEEGTLDIEQVDSFLERAVSDDSPYIILALSMQSNVTSVRTDIAQLQALIKQFISTNPGFRDRLFLSLDLAAFAPHGNINLSELTRDDLGTPLVDSIAFSPYKLDGGQQGSGIALVRASITGNVPVVKAGGTVAYVYRPTKQGTVYSVSDRYDLANGGSPNVMGVVNVYLGLLVKEWIGESALHSRESALARYAYDQLHGFQSPKKFHYLF